MEYTNFVTKFKNSRKFSQSSYFLENSTRNEFKMYCDFENPKIENQKLDKYEKSKEN